jgi:biotin synthase
VIQLVRELRRRTKLGITVCLGTLAVRDFDQLRDAGADYYIIKLETGDAAHYETILAPGTLAERVKAIRHLSGSGWKVSSGFIVGLPGQTDEMIAATLDLLASLPLAGCSVSPFIAGQDTPFANQPNGCLDTTLNCVALMRLLSPQWIIPAVSAMKMVGHDGYARALNAGANLTTINLTPSEWRSQYPIYKYDRFIMDEDRVLNAIDQAGCLPSATSMACHLRAVA